METKVININASCGSQGCDVQPYSLPYSATKEQTDKYIGEKMKEQGKKKAA